MIALLAWVVRYALGNLKAGIFSMMAFYVNLALFASNPGTRYLNELLLVTHEGTGPYTRNGSRLFITVRSSGLCRSNFSDSATGGNHLV